MPDPLVEAGAHGRIPLLLSFAVALATTVAGSVAGALRFSGRITSAEGEAGKLAKRLDVAEALAGKLADEIKAVRADRPSQIISEAEVQRRIDVAVERAVESLETEVRRLHAEHDRIRIAVERGMDSHVVVREALARIQGALSREGTR